MNFSFIIFTHNHVSYCFAGGANPDLHIPDKASVVPYIIKRKVILYCISPDRLLPGLMVHAAGSIYLYPLSYQKSLA